VSKDFPPQELAWRVFAFSMLGIAGWIAAAFTFVVLAG
jgi:hypothetical protein